MEISNQIKGADNMLSAGKNTAISGSSKGEPKEKEVTEINSGKEYKRTSKDGDTLEISSDGEGKAMFMKRESANDKLVISESPQKSDAELRSCSKSQLRKLLNEHKITKQQYERYSRNKEA